MAFKLAAEFKAKWLAALRSGEYDQGQGALRQISDSGPSYCCLGVACKITPSINWSIEHDAFVYGDSYASQLPTPAMINGWLDEGQEPITGYDDWTVMISPDSDLYNLARDYGYPRPSNCGAIEVTLYWLNDHGATFAQIADLIESQF